MYFFLSLLESYHKTPSAIMWSVYALGSIHTKDARFFCYGNSAADISKPHTFKWEPLADEVLEAE